MHGLSNNDRKHRYTLHLCIQTTWNVFGDTGQRSAGLFTTAHREGSHPHQQTDKLLIPSSVLYLGFKNVKHGVAYELCFESHMIWCVVCSWEELWSFDCSVSNCVTCMIRKRQTLYIIVSLCCSIFLSNSIMFWELLHT